MVYLTSRDVGRGQEAVKQLNELNLKPKFHQLDIDDQQSVNTFQEYIKNTYGGVDILVNNAAIAYKVNKCNNHVHRYFKVVFQNDAKDPFSEQAEGTIKTNYFGLSRMCDALFPIMRENGNVVNVSSSAGLLTRLTSPELRAKFASDELTIPELNDLMLQFVKYASVAIRTIKYYTSHAATTSL